MPDDVIINKSEIIERCLKRIHEIYEGNPLHLTEDQTRQDAILLNIERACQSTIDLAMRWVRLKTLGIPKETREAFILLKTHHFISEPLSLSLQKMVGFRNIAIHDYQELSLEVVQKLIQNDFQDIRAFIKIAIAKT